MLQDLRGQKAGSLSSGQQQMLATRCIFAIEDIAMHVVGRCAFWSFTLIGASVAVVLGVPDVGVR